MIEELRKALAELGRAEPTSKTALVREVFPEIEEALAEGYTVKSIWERCRGAGLETSYKDFCTYVNRDQKTPQGDPRHEWEKDGAK